MCIKGEHDTIMFVKQAPLTSKIKSILNTVISA